MMALLAHGSRGSADELLLAVGAIGLFAGLARMSNRAAGRRRWLGVPLMLAAVGIAAVPTLVASEPPQARVRIASTARLSIVSPGTGTLVRGDTLRVVLRLDGARLIDRTTTRLLPDEGHIHVSVDGLVVSTPKGLETTISVGDLRPGDHVLGAEFVALDHGPFRPPVRAFAGFRTPS